MIQIKQLTALALLFSVVFISGCGSGSNSSSQTQKPKMSQSEAVSKCQAELINNASSMLPPDDPSMTQGEKQRAIEKKAQSDLDRCVKMKIDYGF